MAAAPSLRLDVSELLDRPGASASFREHLRVPASSACPASDVDADLRIDAMLDGLAVSGTLEGRLDATCSRCLGEAHVDLRLEVREVFLEPGEETAADEAYPIEGGEIDLEPLIRDTVALSLPTYPRCSDDCAGLCPVCGENRAETACTCTTTSGDPRFAVLADLNLPRKD